MQQSKHTLLIPERLQELAAHRPFIYPRSMTIDNGKGFKSNAVTQVARTFEMNIVFSPPRTPTAKSIVERTLGSNGTMFTQYLPGYTGRSPEFRGLKVEERTDLLDLFTVQELFHDWVLNVLQNHPHSDLIDPLHPGVHFSPNQIAASAAGVVGTIQLSLTREAYIGMLPRVSRALRSTGFQINNHRYDSKELMAFRGQVRLMEVYFDPYNPETVWAKTPDGAFNQCRTRDWDAMNNPFFSQFQPDGTELAPPDPLAEARAEAALVGSTISPELPSTRTLEPLPTSFFDVDVDEVTEFNPEGNL